MRYVMNDPGIGRVLAASWLLVATLVATNNVSAATELPASASASAPPPLEIPSESPSFGLGTSAVSGIVGLIDQVRMLDEIEAVEPFLDGLDTDGGLDQKSFDEVKRLAGEGNTFAMLVLGGVLIDGEAADKRRGLAHIEQAAELDNPMAQFIMAWAVAAERGPQEASRWVTRLAERPEPIFQTLAAIAYSHPSVGINDEPRARAIMRRSAQQGEPIAQHALGMILLLDPKQTDRKEAFRLFTAASEQGIAASWNMLGVMHKDAMGIGYSPAAAFRAFRQAAEGGDMHGMINLGAAYNFGTGTSIDHGLARRWYQRAADLGSPAAAHLLGLAYWLGHGVAKDYARAAEYLELAISRGYVQSLTSLGELYEEGHGVAKDPVKAVEYFRRAAAAGDARAKGLLGIAYRTGSGVEKDVIEGLKWYRLGAEHGDAGAQFNLGWLYETGDTVKKDYAKAVELYEQAYEGGFMRGNGNAAVLFERGGYGLAKDMEQALLWNRRAAKEGNNAKAYIRLGDLYLSGTAVPKDLVAARTYYEGGAELGDPVAIVRFAEVLSHGQGGPREPKRAFELLSRAIKAHGDNEEIRGLIAEHTFYGIGTKQDVAAGLRLATQSADERVGRSAFILGYAHMHGLTVPQNLVVARDWFEKSATRSNHDAMEQLAQFFENGWGGPVEMDRAVDMYVRAAKLDNLKAIARLGVMFVAGHGVSRDVSRGVELLRTAAARGDQEAMHNLGYALETGANGKPDFIGARRLYESAAGTRVDSRWRLSVMILEGRFGKPDVVRAYTWLETIVLASPSEFTDKAKQLQARLRTRMKAQDVKIATQNAADWIAGKARG